MNAIYWVALVLAFFAGGGLVTMLHQALALARKPAPGRPAPQHRKEPDYEPEPREDWVEQLYPTWTPPVPDVDHRHEFGPEGPEPCWCGWGTPVQPPRVRPYTADPYASNGGQQAAGQAIIP